MAGQTWTNTVMRSTENIVTVNYNYVLLLAIHDQFKGAVIIGSV